MPGASVVTSHLSIVMNRVTGNYACPLQQEYSMQTIHAIYENGLFRPTDTVELPDPCEVELNIQSRHPTAIRQTTLARLAEIGRSFPANPALPEDLAAQHDHYLYGLPKQP